MKDRRDPVARLLLGLALGLVLEGLIPGRAEAAADGSAALEARVAQAVEVLHAVLESRGGVVAVAPVSETQASKGFGLHSAVGASLVKALKDAGFEVRDSQAVKETLGEAARSAALGGDGHALQTLSKRLGARTVLVTQLGVLGETLVVDIKALDPESAQVVAATDQKLPLSLFAQKKQPRSRAYTGAGSDERVEIAMRRLADGLVVQLQKAMPDTDLRYVRAGVLPFEEIGKGAKKKELGRVVAAEVSTILQRDHGLLLVERAQVTAVLREQALGASGAIDPETAASLGKILGVEVLVLGSVSEVGDHYRIDAKVVDAEDAQVLAAENHTLPAASLIALSADAVVLRSRSGAAFRSLLIPGWGQFYNRESVKGGVFLTAEAALFGAATTFHLLGKRSESEYHLPQDVFASKYKNDPDGRSLQEVAEDLRLAATSSYRTRNTFLIIAAGLWAYNLLDAYINGVPANADTALVLAPTGEGAVAAVALRF